MLKLVLYICIIVFCASCAQITPLTGGKKDEVPPKAIKYSPENLSLNFNAKSIEITFNEYIVLKDVINQFIITPQTKELPDIQANGKKLKISFNEPLLPNTTYKLSFGSSIADLHESNSIPNFEYVFSTGNSIDSLMVKGKIIDYKNLKPVKGYLVGLYNSNETDSAVFKSKPLYVSKTKEDGAFTFNYLPSNQYKMVAINDKNKNVLYDGSEEDIAYSDNLVNTNDSTIIELIAFKELVAKSFIKKTSYLEPGKVLVLYNKPQQNIKNVTGNGVFSFELGVLKDSLFIYYNNLKDTLSAQIVYTSSKSDSIIVKIPQRVKANVVQKPKLNYVVNCNCNGSLPYFENIQLTLNYPIKQTAINTDSIFLLEIKDSIKTKIPITISDFKALSTRLTIKANIKPETNYQLLINKSALRDEFDRVNDSVVYKFKTTAKEDYAQLNLKIIAPKKENYIIMLFNESNKLVKEQIIEFSLASSNEKIIEFKNLLPSNYTVKAVLDENKNAIFDTGDYIKKIQAEKVFILTTPIKILSGWETEQEWLIK